VLLNRMGEEAPQRVVAVPLNVRQRAVAVLYADSGSLDSEAINLEALETLVQVSGMSVDLLAGHAAAKAPAPEPAPAPTPAEAGPDPSSYAPEREYAAPEPTVEEVRAEEVQALPVTPEEIPAEIIEEPQPADLVADVVEAEEAAPERAELGAAPAEIVAQTAPRRRGADVELPVSVSGEEERRLHIDARRFARLLVSEIKLYNEQKVSDGRAQGDLYDRLREYIDRSREMYDKRVKPEVASSYDYFHHELVNTLAEGDPAKLGNAYPGATVSA
jgi:hypothetical protein